MVNKLKDAKQGSVKTSDKKLKVVQLCAVDFTVRQFISPLILALMQQGHHVSCVCSLGPHWQELEDQGIQMVPISIARSANPFKAFKSIIAVTKYLREERPDILHVHTPVASFVGRIAGRLSGVPFVIYTAHGFYFHDSMPFFKKAFHITLERFFAKLTDLILCVSREDTKTAMMLDFIHPNRLYTVSNGANPKRFRPQTNARQEFRKTLGINDSEVVILYMGRMVREKGILELLEAFSNLTKKGRKAKLILAGTIVVSEHDNAMNEIRELITRHQIEDDVIMPGFCDNAENYMQASDIFCLPSWREGLPVSLIEAMMTELPCVTTDIRGCRELIEDGRFGFTVPPKDSTALEEALVWLIEHPEESRKMGQEARKHALKNHHEDSILHKQCLYYKRIARMLAR